MKKIGKLILVLGLLDFVISLGIGLAANSMAKSVTLITPHSPDIVNINKSVYQSGDNVAELYGNPLSKPTKLLFIDQKRIIVPQEDPTLLLYSVDKQKGENPLQLQSIWLFVYWGIGSGLGTAILGYFLNRK